MKIAQLLKEKQENLAGAKPVTIAFLGDSVTQGCFETFLTSPTSMDTVYDYKSVYSTRLREILNLLYPSVPVNIINSGISGDRAFRGIERLERDVLSYHPDLVVVAYGLNDSCGGESALPLYEQSLRGIFEAIRATGAEIIFLATNAMNTAVSPHLKEEVFLGLAKKFSETVQNNGLLRTYYDTAKRVSTEYGVKVCDLYSVWERMAENGVATTELLANKLNHPVREIHTYMAMKLMECMLLD